MATDYYKTLGVSRTADEKEIKTAYRKLARKYHPDVNPNDKSAESRFKEISEAYDVLGDSEKRPLYDQYGANWDQAAQGGVSAEDVGGFNIPNGGGFGDFSSIFEQMFSGGRGGRVGVDFRDFEVHQPADVEKTIEIPLEEIDSGGKRTLTYQTMDAQRNRGDVSTVPTTKKVEITIPAGIAEGKKLRVPGEGAGRAERKGGRSVRRRQVGEAPEVPSRGGQPGGRGARVVRDGGLGRGDHGSDLAQRPDDEDSGGDAGGAIVPARGAGPDQDGRRAGGPCGAGEDHGAQAAFGRGAGAFGEGA